MARYRFIASALRRMKRRYGQEVFLTRVTNLGTTDYTTGVTTGIESCKHKIRRAIVLPSRLKRNFSYPLSFIAANKNFTYGGFYDIAQRTIILDNKDIEDFTLDIDTDLEMGTKKYEIKEINEYEEARATLIIVVEAKGDR